MMRTDKHGGAYAPPSDTLAIMIERDEARLRESKTRVQESAKRIARALHGKIVTGKMQHCGERKYIVHLWVMREPGIEDSWTVSKHLLELLKSENGVHAQVFFDFEFTFREQLMVASLCASVVVAAMIATTIINGTSDKKMTVSFVIFIFAFMTMWFTFFAAYVGNWLLHTLFHTTRLTANMTDVTSVHSRIRSAA